MNKILELAWEYRYVLAVVVAILIYVIVEWKKTKLVLQLHIIKARDLAKKAILESGKEQEDWVVIKVWGVMPQSVRLFLTPFGGEEALRKLVKLVYNGLKDYLDDGDLNGSWQI